MPKPKSTPSQKIRNYIKEFGEKTLSTDGSILLCVPCGKKISDESNYLVKQHLSTAKHKNAALQMDANQQLIGPSLETQGKESEFALDLCRMFIAGDIPFNKLQNPSVRGFYEKYISNQVIPHESTIRKGYLSICYKSTMTKIQESVANRKIWVSVDETTDAVGRFVANVVIGVLSPDAPGKTFLLTTEELSETNHTTIARLFIESIKLLGNSFDSEDILLFLTDAAPYMKKAGKSLRVLYPKMIHVTCLAHGLSRVAETVRVKYSDIDRLIANGKKVFRKCPSRIQAFRAIAPMIPLPPRPVLTRWGKFNFNFLFYLWKHNLLNIFVRYLACSCSLLRRQLCESARSNQ